MTCPRMWSAHCRKNEALVRTVGSLMPKGNSRFYLADLIDPLSIAHYGALSRHAVAKSAQNVRLAMRAGCDSATGCTRNAMEHSASFSPHRAAASCGGLCRTFDRRRAYRVTAQFGRRCIAGRCVRHASSASQRAWSLRDANRRRARRHVGQAAQRCFNTWRKHVCNGLLRAIPTYASVLKS